MITKAVYTMSLTFSVQKGDEQLPVVLNHNMKGVSDMIRGC